MSSEADNTAKAAARKQGKETRARSLARRLAMQAIYQWQISADDWEVILHQFEENQDYSRVDGEYFRELLEQVITQEKELLAVIEEYFDRPLAQLDPVERAVLLVGVFELKHRIEVPYRVVLNESVDLARKFGAAESHKFINAILDKAAASLRKLEVKAAGR